MVEASPQDQGFDEWYSQRENKLRVGEVWFKEWKREYWKKDASKPEQPLTPEEKEKADAYVSRIQEHLECRDIKDEGVRERAMGDFAGIVNLGKLYENTSGGDREALIRAMGTVIDRAEQHPKLSADLIFFVRHKQLINQADLAKVEPSIKRLSRTPLATEHEGLNGEIEHFKRLRSWDALPPQRLEQIYQDLRNTSPQSSEQ